MIFIVIFAYLLRILPYLFGYPIPVTEDGILDFGQVKYLLENNSLNLYDHQLGFGSFPILHLLVFALAKTGLPPMTVFLFVPQLLASLGIMFFYLFAKKYTHSGQALIAAALIAVFIPHIHWASQPVRETVGLFFFPLVIYLADRLKSNPNIRWWLINIAAIGLMVASHHWSTIMLIVWLVGFNLLFAKQPRPKIIYGLLAIIAAGLALAYWSRFFPRGLNLLLGPVEIWGWLWLAVLIAAISGLLMAAKRAKIDPNTHKNKTTKIICLIIGLAAIMAAGKFVAPLAYPLQIWLNLGIIFALAYIGFFYGRHPATNRFLLLASSYLLLWLIVTPYLLSGDELIAIPIDPFRTLEFIIFPLSLVASRGLLIIWRQSKSLTIIIGLSLIFLATLAYPPIFIYGSAWRHTPFYDIRSDIRYLSPPTMELIDWANQHGFAIKSIIPEARAYQQVFYSPQNKNLTLIRNSDQIISQANSKIKDPIMKISQTDPELKTNQTIIYQNGAGKLVMKKYAAQFIDQSIPASASAGQPADAWIKMKNTGGQTWQPDEGIKMIHLYVPDLIMELKAAVNSGQEGIFFFTDLIPDYAGDNASRWQLFHKEIGFFGDISPLTMIKITN